MQVSDTPVSAAAAAFPAGSPTRRALRWTIAVFATWLVWSANLFFPNEPALGLDPSWQSVLCHAVGRPWVFGRDLVYTYGPWGWLTTLQYDAVTFFPRMAWEIGFKAFASVMVVLAATTLAWPRRIAFVAAAILFPPLFQDTLPMLLIVGLTLLAMRSNLRWPLLVAIGATLGFLSLQKFTYLLIAGDGLTCVVGQRLRTPECGRSLAALLGGTTASFLTGWVAAGQPLAAIPLFLQHSAWVASGYTEAMFLDESPAVFALGISGALLFLLLVWDRVNRESWPAALALTGFGFLAWKHGFVRADGHTLGFFFFVLFAGIAAPRLNPSAGWGRHVTSGALCAVALGGCLAAEPAMLTLPYHTSRLRLVKKTELAFQLPWVREIRDRQTRALALGHALPAVRAAIGDATVDQFGNNQAILLLNAFNYRPRPVFQSFQAYSEPLARLNETAALSPDGAEFLLASLETIDGRYPTLDDAALLPRLQSDYRFVLAEGGFLLLQKNSAPSAVTRKPLASGSLRYGTEAQTLPPGSGTVWASIEAPYSWLGRLRTFFYKPPELSLVVRDADDIERRFRLIVPAARAGFLLSPMLLDTADLSTLLTQSAGREVRSIRLELPRGGVKYFRERARFEFARLDIIAR